MPVDPKIFKMEIEHPSAANALTEYTKAYSEDIDSLQGHWVGTEKKRYDFVLKYLSSHSTKRGYAVHNFVDKDGARFLAFLDAEDIYVDEGLLKAGDCFSCKATINRHGINTFKHGSKGPFKETVLNRMKFKQFLGRAEMPYEEKLAAL